MRPPPHLSARLTPHARTRQHAATPNARRRAYRLHSKNAPSALDGSGCPAEAPYGCFLPDLTRFGTYRHPNPSSTLAARALYGSGFARPRRGAGVEGRGRQEQRKDRSRAACSGAARSGRFAAKRVRQGIPQERARPANHARIAGPREKHKATRKTQGRASPPRAEATAAPLASPHGREAPGSARRAPSQAPRGQPGPSRRA